MRELVVALLLAVHLICVNVASAGPLVCICLDWRGDRAVARRAARFLAFASIAMLLMGVAIGVAVAGVLWNEAYHDLMHRFAYKITWGAWELLFSVILMAWYAVLVGRAPARRLAWRLLRASLAILAATNLLYHFPTLFFVISEVRGGHLDPPPEIDAAVFRRLMSDRSVVAQTAHFWLASVAVTGVSLMAFARWLQSRPEDREDANKLATWGARIALVPTLLQILVGVWILSVLPASSQQRVLGSDVVAASCLGLAVVGALWLMHQLSSVAFGDTKPKTLSLAIWLMVLVVTLMTISARRALAEPNILSSGSQEIHRAD